jgi:hypothetical protein
MYAFKEISVDELVPEEKYRIHYYKKVKVGRYAQLTPYDYLYFKGKDPIFIPLSLYDPIEYYCLFFQPIFQKDKIQQAMEQRALNLILQWILSDPYFLWSALPQ